MNAASAAVDIWRSRHGRMSRDTAFRLYAAIAVTGTAVAPLVRAAWLAAVSDAGAGVLAAPGAPAAVAAGLALLWAGALVVGARRGPALRPSFLLHALASSGIPRAVSLRAPMLRAAGFVVAAVAGAALFVGGALRALGYASDADAAAFVVAAAGAGLVAAVAWLAGQAFPRAAGIVALGILALAMIGQGWPALASILPWHGAAYPVGDPSPSASVVLSVSAVAAVAAVPWMLTRLTGAQLSSQAGAQARAMALSYGFDFGAASGVYEAMPRRGRGIRAVRAFPSRAVAFLVLDVVVQARRPWRFIRAIAAVCVSGGVLALAAFPDAPTMLLAGTAGLLLHVAAGSITSGLRHAVHAAGDHPLYGTGDLPLVLLRALFPLVVVAVVVSASAGAVGGIAAAVGAGILGVLVLAVRLAGYLRGPLPPWLLMPISSPAGDPGVLLRLVWALGEPLLAVVAGLAVALLPQGPVPAVAVAAWVGMLVVMRWRKRR